MKVVTSGSTYLDIDGYGGCIAYAELLRLQGEAAIAASTATWNESITQTVRSWKGEIQDDHETQPGDEFVLIDVSEPKFFDRFVDLNSVSEIIDHHPGKENYWRERLGDNAKIKLIGAACTQVYQEYEHANLSDKISQTSARLLATGILDNTLNFKALITTDADKEAYEKLMMHANLPEDWPAQYFTECQQAIMSDLETAIANDIKHMDTKTYNGLPEWLGQLVIWDASPLLQTRKMRITESMRARGADWAMHLVSIGEGRSYLLAEDRQVQANLEKILGVKFQGNLAAADRLWLRKEIMQAALDHAK